MRELSVNKFNVYGNKRIVKSISIDTLKLSLSKYLYTTVDKISIDDNNTIHNGNKALTDFELVVIIKNKKIFGYGVVSIV